MCAEQRRSHEPPGASIMDFLACRGRTRAREAGASHEQEVRCARSSSTGRLRWATLVASTKEVCRWLIDRWACPPRTWR